MSISRRRFLVAGSAAIAVAAGSPIRAQPLKAARRSKIDALLRHAIDAGDVLGVIAMATDRHSVIYEGAYGKRILGQPSPMTADTVVWIASMTKAAHGRRRHAAGRAGQARPRRPGRQGRA